MGSDRYFVEYQISTNRLVIVVPHIDNCQIYVASCQHARYVTIHVVQSKASMSCVCKIMISTIQY